MMPSMTSRALLAMVGLIAWASAALADDRVPPVTDPTVLKECGACHMPFPPALLPQRSWNGLLDGLSDHFGEDASLPADKVEIIRAYLAANAGDAGASKLGRKYMRWVAPGGTPRRITENPAFLREHRFPASVWQDPKVVTKSNCLACHDGAGDGRFE